jgi:hypothetical protein
MKQIRLTIILLGLFFSSLTSAMQIADSTKTSELNSSNTTTSLQTDYGIVRIPGLWMKFSYEKESRQHFLKDREGVIIGVAMTPMKLYSFYAPSKNRSQIISDFFNWEYEYRVGAGFKCAKIKENKTDNYIIWKFTEKMIDNVFLYGTKSDFLINFLVYTDKWDEKKKIDFLEQFHSLNNSN